MFSQKDINQIEQRGATVSAVEQQIEHFKNGFPWMRIDAPATPERGIRVLSEEEADAAISYYEGAQVAGKCKFVPASGAASRMFKDIFAGLAALEKGDDLPADAPGAKLAAQIDKFAFYTEELFGAKADTAAYRKSVLSKVLTDEGLGYGAKPKGVIKFHRYADGEVRTAIAEHLVEAATYMRNADGTCNLVVTISPEHKPLFEAALAEAQPVFEARYGVKYNVTFTYQDKATDTIAVDAENEPFRTDEGGLLFRPAGHGALIYNLNKVDEELVSIKNIDNVAHEKLLGTTARYKKVLMGEALKVRDRIFGYLRKLDEAPTKELCAEIEQFLEKELCVRKPVVSTMKLETAERILEKRIAWVRAKLDRPIRVCGMVRNEGEPGGGPYIIDRGDGSTSLQILESVQIDKSDARAMDAMSHATHFNPVDLVCCLRDYKGGKFDLLKHVDPQAGFISSKSFQGRELKALELPGLWNGAMSDWNTLFVEVPLETFNPVKVVLDLLRPAHQA